MIISIPKRPARRLETVTAAVLAALFAGLSSLHAQLPYFVNYQGRLVVSGTNFDGPGQFKFALVNRGAAAFWSNDGTSSAGSQPVAAVSLPVRKGLYTVLLGDTSLANMAALPASVFTNSDLRLRVWFNDGPHGFQLLSPDQPVAAVGYAMLAATVPDGAITAEKLAPLLTAQLAAMTSQLLAFSNQVVELEHRATNLSIAGLTATSPDPRDAVLAARGFEPEPVAVIPPAPWVNGSTVNALSGRSQHAAVWDGQELVVWGGNTASGKTALGGIYHPDSDQWESMATGNAPSARSGPTAVWTGSEMIVWGGQSANSSYLNTGGRFKTSPQGWGTVSTNGAPVERAGHIAIWTGSRMVVWGGLNRDGLLDDGALYDPVADQWTALALPNPPEARLGATAVWAGDRLIIWGGTVANGALNTGAQLLFAGGAPSQWVALSLADAPSPRNGHTAVWTGQKMIVWGGFASQPLGDGAAYDPVSNSWTALSPINAPAARFNHASVWTGFELLVLCGMGASSELASGAAYDLAAGQWRTLSGTGSPQARTEATGVWTGTEVVVFGGRANSQPVGALQRLVPQRALYLYRKL